MTEPIRLLQMCCLSMLVLLLSLASCGGGSPVDIGDAAGDLRAADVWIPDVIQVDTSHVETVSTVDTDGSGGSDDVDATFTGGFMDPCDDNGDCKFGYCVAYLGEKVCTQECVEECPQGWECTQLQGGREPVWVCMSEFAHLCLPCIKSADCVFGGVGVVACVSYGPDGAFCGADCEEDLDCPEGFTCQDATSTEGASARQCVVPDGMCPCGSLAEDLGLGALCFVENQWGICTGTRVCLDGVLTDCDASTPAKEVCNQVDDDCDSFVDEEIDNCCVCGDGICHNFCESLETCSPDCAACGDGICSPGESPCACEQDCCGTCGDGKCASYVVEGQQCCTESPESCPEDCQTSTCGNGECEPGEHPLNCPQDCELFFCGNHMCEPGEEPGGEKDCPQDCTEFCGNCVCEPDESFITCPMDCGFCGDGVCSQCPGMGEWDTDNDTWICAADCCNPADVCQPDGLPPKECGPNGCGGVCGNCDDANPCTQDVCLGTGYCQHTAVADDTPCDDGGKCIGKCQAGVCVETAVGTTGDGGADRVVKTAC